MRESISITSETSEQARLDQSAIKTAIISLRNPRKYGPAIALTVAAGLLTSCGHETAELASAEAAEVHSLQDSQDKNIQDVADVTEQQVPAWWNDVCDQLGHSEPTTDSGDGDNDEDDQKVDSETSNHLGEEPAPVALLGSENPLSPETCSALYTIPPSEWSAVLGQPSSPSPSASASPNPNPSVSFSPSASPSISPSNQPLPSHSPSPTKAPTGNADAPIIPFSDNSFLKTPLGPDWPSDPTSDEGIAYLKSHQDYLGIASSTWSAGFAQVLDCESATNWKLASNAVVQPGQEFLKQEGFYGPADLGTLIPPNNDAPLVVDDECSKKVLWITNAGYDGNGDHILTTNPLSNSGAIGGNAMDSTSNGLDSRDPLADSPDNATSRGMNPMLVPAIRKDDMDYALSGGNDGTLGQPLGFSMPDTDTSMGFVSPFVGLEHGHNGYGAEGQRIAAVPEWQPPANCDGEGLVVARTLQKYGGIIINNSGSGAVIKTEAGYDLPNNLLADCLTLDEMKFVDLQYQWTPDGMQLVD